MIDYEALRFIWWILLGVLFVGFAITDGFDMGVGALLPFFGKNDTERRVMINTIAPHWDGNQVWLITAGGALFAAWPTVFGVSFSGFYLAMIIVLLSLYLRPVGFDYRSKLDNTRWRKSWDWALCVGGFVPPLIIGVAFGNLLQGVPFKFDDIMRATYEGNLLGLLNPFGILSGLMCVAMFLMQGSVWLQMKTTAEMRQRASKYSLVFALLVLVLFVIAGAWLYMGIDGYALASVIDHNAPSNPMVKKVVVEAGAWMVNFDKYPVTQIFPLLALAGPVLVMLMSKFNRSGFAFLFSSLTVLGVIVTCGVMMFPFVMPSSIDPNVSLTMWDATASKFTLEVMTVAAAIFVPIVLAYTLWGYYKMFGRIDSKFVESNTTSLY